MPKFLITAEHNNTRLDKVMAKREPLFSRAFWQRALASGQVLVNGYVKSAKMLVKEGDEISYQTPHSQVVAVTTMLSAHPKAPLDIIYENEDVLVINKPRGLITHPAHANTEDSVVQRIVKYIPSITKTVYDPTNPISIMRPGIVHRLDKDTSGVLIVAKTPHAMSHLAKQIEARQVSKHYTALLFGHLEISPWEVHTYLNRDKADRRKMAVVEEGSGRQAKTVFHIDQLLTSKKGDKATLAKIDLLTGRTHQIRVHASHIHHPVLGDSVYTTKEATKLSKNIGLKRQFLHASSLTIVLPRQIKGTAFTAPLPLELKTILEQFSEIKR